jgi:hypothetical protein
MVHAGTLIQWAMLCGIGLLAGCFLMLPFIPLVHARAVRLTKRQLAGATPMTAKEIAADKAHLRAEFAMSVRRLEIGMEDMRAKATARAADRQNAEIGRLQVEIDRKIATIVALRAREEVRKDWARRMFKILLYFYVRSKRRAAVAAAPAAPIRPERERLWNHDQRSEQSELAAAAAAIAALNLRRRHTIANKYDGATQVSARGRGRAVTSA